MNLSYLSDIGSSIRSFFSSLSTSMSFDLIFIIGIAIELLFVIFFLIKSLFAYEMRATRSLNRLNKWLFVNKKLNTENIKEFTNLVKTGPSRISYNWQQYILFREKNPSEYMNNENIIEKPLRASSFSSNSRNLGLVTIVLSFLVFILSLSYENSALTSSRIFSGSSLVVSCVVPLIIIFIGVLAIIGINTIKNSNLNEIYQNLHIFHRFIDNACVDLPSFIDFTLLFSVQEIEKGIPALREYLEDRARKEKEEFDKAQNEAIVFEKYDFEKAGIDGSNILERAMQETEMYLNKKEKTLVKISQFEATLESLKKNFDNVQKDYQKKMQTSKENIDRLRQQQEETTSRIESNFLRKQQATEIAKQEKEEQDFEQQKRRYLVEKGDYEDEIKNLNTELENSKVNVEKNMLSEYQTFYKKLCEKSVENINTDVKNEMTELLRSKEKVEDELSQMQTHIKRLEDEKSTLIKKLSMEMDGNYNNTPIESRANLKIQESKYKPNKDEKQNSKEDYQDFVFDFSNENGNRETNVNENETNDDWFEQFDNNIESSEQDIKGDDKNDMNSNNNGPVIESIDNLDLDDDSNQYVSYQEDEFSDVPQEVPQDYEFSQENGESIKLEEDENVENFDDEFLQQQDNAEREQSHTIFKNFDDENQEDILDQEIDSESMNDQEINIKNLEGQTQPIKKRGRPVGSFKVKTDIKKKKRGRPRKEEKTIEISKKTGPGRPRKNIIAEKKRGRPVGSVKVKLAVNENLKRKPGRPKKVVIETVEKKKRGRPVGTTKKANSPSIKYKKVEITKTTKKGRGRPRKEQSVNDLSSKIKQEQIKIQQAQKNANEQIKKTISTIDNGSPKSLERQKIIADIERLKTQALKLENPNSQTIERINNEIEKLLKKISELED